MSWAIEYLIQSPRPDVGGWDLNTHFITKCTVLHTFLDPKTKMSRDGKFLYLMSALLDIFSHKNLWLFSTPGFPS